MEVTAAWHLPDDAQMPTSIAFSGENSFWIADWSAYLLHYTAGMSGDPHVQLHTAAGPATVAYVASGAQARLWIIDDQSTGQAGLWDISQQTLTPITLQKEPRQLAWAEATGALWYLANDLSLNIYHDGGETSLAGEYTALSVAPHGERIAVRQSGTDDILVTSTRQVAFQRVREAFSGEIVGFGPDDELLLLDVGIARKGQALADSRLFAVRNDGSEDTITQGLIVFAAAYGRNLVLIRRDSSAKLSAELILLK